MPKFAEEAGRTKQSAYGQLSGDKGISKDTAIVDGEILKVDPVIIISKTYSIWGYKYFRLC